VEDSLEAEDSQEDSLEAEDFQCYDNATYASFFLFSLFISCLVTDHLMSHVTTGQVILTMTHRLKAFTLDAGLLLHMSLSDSWIAVQVLMTCVDSFLDCT
jgi:hypothetical protein